MAATSDALKALRRIAPDVKTILEGVVPSAYPEKMLREEGCDFVCQGEAFEPIVALLRALKGGKPHPENPILGIWWMEGDRVVTSTRAPLVQKPDMLPFVAWDLLPMERYRAHHWHCFDDLDRRQPYASVYTNLGCPYTCTFCNVNVIYGKANFRSRTPENVMAEIDLLVRKYGVRNIRIVDNVFTIALDFCEKLCDLIISRSYDLNMWCYARVETIKELPLLQKMKKAGINWIAYGIEAASENIRHEVDKGSSERVIERAIELTRQADINIVGNFIFGLPEDTYESMRQSLDMSKQYNFEYANFFVAMAYPGTELHEYAKRQGIELPKSWSGYGHYSEDALPMSTRHLTPAQILRFRDEAFVEYNTNPTYLNMMKKKFGQKTIDYIHEILKIKLHRKQFKNQ